MPTTPPLDLAPHLVDLALLLTRSETARVRSASLEQDRAELVLETERGPATIRCATDQRHRELVAIRDGSGAAVARSAAGGRLALITATDPGARAPAGRLAERRSCARSPSAARGGDPDSLATAADGARVMALIDEARRLGAPEPA